MIIRERVWMRERKKSDLTEEKILAKQKKQKKEFHKKSYTFKFCVKIRKKEKMPGANQSNDVGI